MDTATNLATVSLEIKHTFTAPIERVFEAWASESAISRWFGPGNEMKTIVEAHDFRVGGEYRYRLITQVSSSSNGAEGMHHVVAGKYLEIDEPHRLVFTWNWLENGMDVGESLVSLDFITSGEHTELILRHEKLPGKEACAAHREGWEDTLECLGQYLQG